MMKDCDLFCADAAASSLRFIVGDKRIVVGC